MAPADRVQTAQTLRQRGMASRWPPLYLDPTAFPGLRMARQCPGHATGDPCGCRAPCGIQPDSTRNLAIEPTLLERAVYNSPLAPNISGPASPPASQPAGQPAAERPRLPLIRSVEAHKAADHSRPGTVAPNTSMHMAAVTQALVSAPEGGSGMPRDSTARATESHCR